MMTRDTCYCGMALQSFTLFEDDDGGVSEVEIWAASREDAEACRRYQDTTAHDVWLNYGDGIFYLEADGHCRRRQEATP